MLREFCAENFRNIPEAIRAGADRVELCDRLDVGGTTPSEQVQKEVLAFAHQHQVKVVTIIRPRGGSFVYTDKEKVMMVESAARSVELGADGIVFGALTPDGQIDWPFIDKLVECGGNKETVFHMAFDELAETTQLAAVSELIGHGINRLLTRGAKAGSALKHYKWINQLVEEASERLEILAGGGLTYRNLAEAAELIHTDQFHGTQIVDIDLENKK